MNLQLIERHWQVIIYQKSQTTVSNSQLNGGMTEPRTGNAAFSSKSDARVSGRDIFIALLKARASEDLNIVILPKNWKRENKTWS